jgi:cytoskeletal protein CcmA (bactofilin family)
MSSSLNGNRSDATALGQFKRKALPTARPADPANVGHQLSIASSVIGPELTILGNLVTKGQVQIDGNIEGDVHGVHVLVGEAGCITGAIIAEEIIVRGRVMGSVHARRVMLQSSCYVAADILHESLTIDPNAVFEGRSQRLEELGPPETPT